MVRPRQYVAKSPIRASRFDKLYGSRSGSFWKSVGRFFLGAALFILDLALLIWLSFRVWNILCADPYFSIDTISVQGLKNFSKDEVIHRAHLNEVRNIFKLDLMEAQRLLNEEPLLKKAEIWKQLPNQIFVKVLEREPIAQVVSHENEEHIWLLDAEGVVLSEVKQLSPVYPLIRIELPQSDLHQRKRIESPGLLKALRVLEIFSGSVLKKMFDLEYVDLTDQEDVVLKNTSGLIIHLGSSDYESRLIRLLSILEDLKKKRQDPTMIDLRFKYVPVTLKEIQAKSPQNSTTK